MTIKKSPANHSNVMLRELRELIKETRADVATTVNAALTKLFWRVGECAD